jgi:hypothetical protein
MFLHSLFNENNKRHQLIYSNIRVQNTLRITCQRLHVSAPRCHHQRVYEKQGFVGPTLIAGAIHHHFHHGSCKSWNIKCLKYFLDLPTFVVDKLPDDGTLVVKHGGVGTWYQVLCNLFYCILISLFCWFFKKYRILHCKTMFCSH